MESSGQRDAIKFPRLVELNHFALALFVLSEIYWTALHWWVKSRNKNIISDPNISYKLLKPIPNIDPNFPKNRTKLQIVFLFLILFTLGER